VEDEFLKKHDSAHIADGKHRKAKEGPPNLHLTFFLLGQNLITKYFSVSGSHQYLLSHFSNMNNF